MKFEKRYLPLCIFIYETSEKIYISCQSFLHVIDDSVFFEHARGLEDHEIYKIAGETKRRNSVELAATDSIESRNSENDHLVGVALLHGFLKDWGKIYF